MKNKDKAADPLKEEMEDGADPEMDKEPEGKDAEDHKMSDSEVEKKAEKVKKGTLICRFTIKGEDQLYKPGDVYKGKNAKYLLSRKSIYREE